MGIFANIRANYRIAKLQKYEIDARMNALLTNAPPHERKWLESIAGQMAYDQRLATETFNRACYVWDRLTPHEQAHFLQLAESHNRTLAECGRIDLHTVPADLLWQAKLVNAQTATGREAWDDVPMPEQDREWAKCTDEEKRITIHAVLTSRNLMKGRFG